MKKKTNIHKNKTTKYNKKIDKNKDKKIDKKKTKRITKTKKNNTTKKNDNQMYIYSSSSSYSNINREENYNMSGKEAHKYNHEMSGIKWNQENNETIKKPLSLKELKDIFTQSYKTPLLYPNLLEPYLINH